MHFQAQNTHDTVSTQTTNRRMQHPGEALLSLLTTTHARATITCRPTVQSSLPGRHASQMESQSLQPLGLGFFVGEAYVS